ncbi:HECA2 protein, partial [Heliornis fulica]|nr:HECA2 protein [Heliornis fulica]
STGEEVTEGRVAAEGSSILMHAPESKNMTFTEWEYIKNATPEFILQYHADYRFPTIYTAYRGRVIFYPQNGSILLQGLRETDSGFYRATVNLMQDKARTTHLEVIKPVPKPELKSTPNMSGSDIQLVCMVPEKPVVSISWKKDGQPLSIEMSYRLSGNSTVLQIKTGVKLYCGIYSCNVSNAISWKEATLDLKATGRTLLHHAQRLAVAALSFIFLSTIIFSILFYLMKEQRWEKEVLKHSQLLAYGLLSLSSLLLLGTSIIWMQEGCRVILRFTVPIMLIINWFFAITFFTSIQWPHEERGCSEPSDLMTNIGLAAVVFIVLLLFLLYLW